MTISTENRKAGPYTGNGSTTSFPFSFKVFTTADVLVVRTNLSATETTLTLGTDYTVTLNSNQDSNAGGTVNLPTALTSGFLLTIASQVSYLQQVDLTNQGGFYPTVINAALDKLTIFTQQLKEQVNRAVKTDISSSVTPAQLISTLNTNAAAAVSSASAAATSATNAAASATTSSNAAATTAANVTAAAASQTAAATSATNAATSASTAATQATNASTSATSASTSATTATTQASTATTQATNASSSATSASTYASNASTSASAAATSATNASTSATNAASSATAASASAAAAAASAAAGLYRQVLDKSANYTIVAADQGTLFRMNTGSGALTVTLPLISTVSDGFKVSVVKWTSDANVVNINRAGSDTINGATSAQIGSQYSQIIFVADFETNTWFASQSGLGATNVNVDVFSGNGITTAFTLSADPSTKNNTTVEISGVYQAKSTYSVSGTTLTFSTAPPTGTNNIEVIYGTPLAIGTPSDGTVTTAKLADGAVTYAKMQNVTAGKVHGRDTSGSGIVQELPIAVDTSGNVGIGTTSPSSYGKLAVNGTIAAGTDQTDQVSLLGGGGTARIEATGGNASVNLALSAKGGGAVYFWRGGYGGTNTMTIDASSNLQFNSGYGSVATAYGCRAWINFNGTGTPAIRGSGNISSITDNGVGDYSLNFTNAMPDSNYAFVGATAWNSGVASAIIGSNTGSSYQNTSYLRIYVLGNSSDNVIDETTVMVSVFR